MYNNYNNIRINSITRLRLRQSSPIYSPTRYSHLTSHISHDNYEHMMMMWNGRKNLG